MCFYEYRITSKNQALRRADSLRKKMQNITIRPMHRREAPAVVKMIRALAAHHGDKAVITAKHLIQHCTGPKKRARVWAAYVGDEPAGFILVYDTINFVRNKASCRIDLLYVEAKHRRKGVAGALVAKVAEDACARCIKRLSVDAMASNKVSNRLYRCLGFKMRKDRSIKYSVEGAVFRRLAKAKKKGSANDR